MSEFYEESLNTSKINFDRYKNCSILKDKETGDNILSTREIVDIPLNAGDVYHTVETTGYIRLDLLAYKYYNNPLLWWVIAQANNIYDPFSAQFSEDLSMDSFNNFSPKVLRIPSIETLYGNRGILL